MRALQVVKRGFGVRTMYLSIPVVLGGDTILLPSAHFIMCRRFNFDTTGIEPSLTFAILWSRGRWVMILWRFPTGMELFGSHPDSIMCSWGVRSTHIRLLFGKLVDSGRMVVSISAAEVRW